MSQLTVTEREANKNAHDSRVELIRKYVDRFEVRIIVRDLQAEGYIPRT